VQPSSSSVFGLSFPLLVLGRQLTVDNRHDTEIIRSLEPVTRQAAVDSYAAGLRVVFIAQAVSSFLSVLFCAFIEENPLPYVTLV
jgi:hypothetical protein